MARFDRDLSTHVYAERVRQDVTSGKNSGVTGTPTFYINGRRHTDEDSLERVVLEAVSRAME